MKGAESGGLRRSAGGEEQKDRCHLVAQMEPRASNGCGKKTILDQSEAAVR